MGILAIKTHKIVHSCSQRISLSLVPRIIFRHWDMEITFRPPPTFYPTPFPPLSSQGYGLGRETCRASTQSVAILRYYRILQDRYWECAVEVEILSSEVSVAFGRSFNHWIRRRWGCCSYFRIALAAAQCPCDGWWSARLPYCRSVIGRGSQRQHEVYDRTDSPSVARPDTCGPADRRSSPRPCIRPLRPAPPIHVAAG